MEETPGTVDEYIAQCPAEVRARLEEMRRLILDLAPEAGEKISYRMPTFVLNGNLVHFAAFARHIGFYPGAAAIVEFEKDLSPYKHAKGSIQFPLTAPLPLDLIERIVKYRVDANRNKKPRR